MFTSFNAYLSINSELSSTQASGLNLLEQHNSRQLYLERLSSYTPLDWWPKPSWAISPLLCARLGWRCVPTPTGSSVHHVDSLLCVRCGATLSVRLPIVRDSDSLASLRKASKEVHHQLLEAHNPSCTWRSLHTPIYTPQRSLSEKSTATDYFQSNAKANFQFLLMLDFHSLPILHSDFLDEIKPSVTELELAMDAALDVASVPSARESEQATRQLAAYLTVCGWQSAADVVCCEFCARRLQLEREFWQAGGEANAGGEKQTVHVRHTKLQQKRKRSAPESPPAAAECSHRLARRRALHPLREHRTWCPWVCCYAAADDTVEAAAESSLAVPPLVRGVREGHVFVEHQFRAMPSDTRSLSGFRVLLNSLLG